MTVSKDGILVEEYHYDLNGTRIYAMNALRGIAARSFSYSDEDHLLSAGSVNYGYDYGYDLDGFLTTKTDGNDITSYTYSSRGELLRVGLPDGRVIEYMHDPLGRRIAKKIDGTITEKYLWQGLTRLLAVYDGSDNLLMRFEYADARMPVAVNTEGATYYLVYDQVGSLRSVADSAGNVIKSIEYNSFGNILNDSNPSFEMPFGFAGGLHDRDTGLVRFGYRDYDPDVGRWTAKDPIGFAGRDTDLYGYVLNDPISLTDSWGLIWVTIDEDLKGHGIMNTLRWYLNRWTQQIGKGLDPTFPGADPEEYVGLQRDVIQEWQHDPDNPCRDKEHSIGAKRRITQKRIKVINRHPPGEALVNDINADYYYRDEPFVPNQTYNDFPESEITGDFQYWTQGP